MKYEEAIEAIKNGATVRSTRGPIAGAKGKAVGIHVLFGEDRLQFRTDEGDVWNEALDRLVVDIPPAADAPLRLYSCDVLVWATAYVKARSPEEARRLFMEQGAGEGLEVRGEGIDSRPLRYLLIDDDAPTVTFSPAMTVTEPGEQTLNFEEAE